MRVDQSRCDGLRVTDEPCDRLETYSACFVWKTIGREFIENESERVDVGARVDRAMVTRELLGTHVLRRPDHALFERFV